MPMKLADFLYEHQLKPAQFARMLGVRSRETVHRYLRGERIPEPKILQRIIEITEGQVQLSDFLDRTPPRCWRYRDQSYPWSRDTETPAPLTPVLNRAIDTLGKRARWLGDSRFELDGRPSDARQIVETANAARKRMGLKLLAYPGVAA